jgi:drug/metabolite transporter (DMT)-like permease
MQTATDATPALRRPAPWVATACVGLLCVVWGSTWVVIREGLDDLPPLTSAAARFSLAGAAMVLLTRALRAREGGGDPPRWLWLCLGGLNFALSYGLVYFTETILDSGLVSVLWGVFPMMMAAIGHWYLPGERLRARQALGFVVGFAGLVVLFLTDVRSLGPRAVPAALLLMLSPFVSAIGTALVKRHGAASSSLALNRNGMLFGALLLAAAASLLERQAPARWSGAAVGSIVYLALVGTVSTFGVYFWLLRTIDANRLGLIAYVTPAVALTLGSLVRGEPVRSTTIGGSALILSGVVLVVRGKRRR